MEVLKNKSLEILKNIQNKLNYGSKITKEDKKEFSELVDYFADVKQAHNQKQLNYINNKRKTNKNYCQNKYIKKVVDKM